MTRWEDEFDNNPIHATLEGIRDFLKVKVDSPDSDVAIEKRRLEKALDLLDSALEQIDKEIAPIALLNQINGHLRQPQFWNQLQAYHSNPAVTYLQAANNHINSQIHVFYQLAIFSNGKKTTRITKPVEKAFDEFCKAVDAKSSEFDETLKGQISKLQEITKSQDELVTEMTNLKNVHKDRLNTWHGEFTDSQTSRAKEFSDTQIQREKEFSEWFSAFTKSTDEKLGNLIAQFKEKIDAYEKDAIAKHNAILDIHDLVATDGVAGGYKSAADDEGAAANKWRLGAFALLGAAAAWLAFKLWLGIKALGENSIDWEEIATSVSLTGILLAAAVYASKQSNFHRNNEKKMRWFALEVKAIDPFLASLSEEDQKRLKAQICERIFGQSDGGSKHETESFDPNIIKVRGGRRISDQRLRWIDL